MIVDVKQKRTVENVDLSFVNGAINTKMVFVIFVALKKIMVTMS